jgi:hypothetical protein
MKAEDFFDLYQSLSHSIDTKKKTYRDVVERVQDLYLFQFGIATQKVYSKIEEIIQKKSEKFQKKVKVSTDQNDYVFEAENYFAALAVIELVLERIVNFTVETPEERVLRKKDEQCNFHLSSTKNMGSLVLSIEWNGSGLELPGLDDFHLDFVAHQIRVRSQNTPGLKNSVQFIFPIIKKMCRFIRVTENQGNTYLLPEWAIDSITKNSIKVAVGVKMTEVQFLEIDWIEGATLVEVAHELSSNGMVYGLCKIEQNNSVGVVINPRYLCEGRNE